MCVEFSDKMEQVFTLRQKEITFFSAIVTALCFPVNDANNGISTK